MGFLISARRQYFDVVSRQAPRRRGCLHIDRNSLFDTDALAAGYGRDHDKTVGVVGEIDDPVRVQAVRTVLHRCQIGGGVKKVPARCVNVFVSSFLKVTVKISVADPGTDVAVTVAL